VYRLLNPAQSHLHWPGCGPALVLLWARLRGVKAQQDSLQQRRLLMLLPQVLLLRWRQLRVSAGHRLS
jgi:hypothetical protein